MDITLDLGVSSAKPDVWLVERDHVKLVWPRIAQIILAKGESTILQRFDVEDLYAMYSGMPGHHLWVGICAGRIEMVWLARMYEYPKVREYDILWSGGYRLASYRKAVEKIEKYAMVQECENAEVVGRSGWGRFLKGYSPTAVVYRKNLRKAWGN